MHSYLYTYAYSHTDTSHITYTHTYIHIHKRYVASTCTHTPTYKHANVVTHMYPDVDMHIYTMKDTGVEEHMYIYT